MIFNHSRFVVPGAGVEPARLLQALDFESSASTNSAIRAWVVLRDANIRPFFFTGKKTLRKGYNVMSIYCDKYKNAGF